MKSLIWAAIIANLKVTPLSSHGDRAVVDRETTRRMERSRGVTILELAIVLLVVGVILGISIPLASSLAGRFKVGSARDVFVNSYARARATAVQYGRVARLHIDALDREVWVEVDTGVVGATAPDTIGIVLNLYKEYGGVTMFSTRQVLCFDSRGLPFVGDPQCETHDASIVFERANKSDTVELSLGGTVFKR